MESLHPGGLSRIEIVVARRPVSPTPLPFDMPYYMLPKSVAEVFEPVEIAADLRSAPSPFFDQHIRAGAYPYRRLEVAP
jgi:hypothetical protein